MKSLEEVYTVLNITIGIRNTRLGIRNTRLNYISYFRHNFISYNALKM